VPNLGAGVDQHVNTAPVPTWVFTPTPSVSSTLRLYNEGSQIVYVGGANVSPINGLPLFPGARPLELQNIGSTIYTCSYASTVGSTISATLSANFVAGGSSVPVTTGYSTGILVGSTIFLGTGTAAEVLVVSATAATTITTSTVTLYDHKTAATVTLASTTPGQLRVTAGVV
jgi:hypothetical protein